MDEHEPVQEADADRASAAAGTRGHQGAPAGLSVHEVARHLGVTAGTVRDRIEARKLRTDAVPVLAGRAKGSAG